MDLKEQLKQTTINMANGKLNFGIKFLDEAAGGIYQNDLIILSAHTGIGKTELAATIAMNNAKEGKQVYFFALEAFKYEIELRNSFKSAMRQFYKDNKHEDLQFTFQQYLERKIPDKALSYIEGAEEESENLSKYLHVKYREGNYTIEDFENDLMKIDLTANLIVIDHLHFFDYDSEKEYSAINRIMKKLNELTNKVEIPIILVSHLRKHSVGSKKIVPCEEDLHGSSNIAKAASKIILLSPDHDREQTKYYLYPTYMRVAKNRYCGSVMRYVASMDYNIYNNSYSPKYCLGKLDFMETKCELLNLGFPAWSESHEKANT